MSPAFGMISTMNSLPSGNIVLALTKPPLHASKHINENTGPGDNLTATEASNARTAEGEFIIQYNTA